MLASVDHLCTRMCVCVCVHSWVAEEKQLMANPKKLAQGTIIEAHLDRRIGPVATLLVQAGTLKVSL